MAETKTRNGRQRRSRVRSSNGARGATKAEGAKDEGKEQLEGLPELASRAKGPALTGGAVMAGLAGAGAVIAARRRGKGVSLPTLKRSRGKVTRKALGKTAKALGETTVAVGKAGYKGGELSAEVRRIREQATRRG